MANFSFYDPYESVFSGAPAAFRNRQGVINQGAQDLHSLLEIAKDIADLMGPMESRERWDEVVTGFVSAADSYREMLTELSESPNTKFFSPAGAEFSPEWDEYGYSSLVHTMLQVSEKAMQLPADESDLDAKVTQAALLAGPLCIAALMEIDDVLLGLVMGSDASPSYLIEPAVRAMRDLSTAKALLKQHVTSGSTFAKIGAAARHAPTREIRKFALNLYRSRNYPSVHKASIEIAPEVIQESIRLKRPLSEDRAQKTIYDWLRMDVVG